MTRFMQSTGAPWLEAHPVLFLGAVTLLLVGACVAGRRAR